MSKLTQSYTVCDWCGGAIPVGNDHIHNVGGVLSIDQTEQSFTGMDFCSADHVAAWISALPAEVPLPDPLYPAPPGAPPTVTSIFPASGNFAGGDTVTLIGTGFTSAIGVTFGSIPATAVFVAADTALTCVSPQQPVPPNRPLPVVVTTPSGTSTQPIQFAYAEPPPPPPGIDVPTGSLMLEGSLVEVNTPPTTPTPPPPPPP